MNNDFRLRMFTVGCALFALMILVPVLVYPAVASLALFTARRVVRALRPRRPDSLPTRRAERSA